MQQLQNLEGIHLQFQVQKKAQQRWVMRSGSSNMFLNSYLNPKA